MIDFNRRDLRSKILEEGVRGARDRDPSRVDAALRKASEQYLLETAEYILANKELVNRNFAVSLQHLENAMRLDPNFPQAHLLKVNVLIEMGNYEEAIKSVDYSLQNLTLVSYAPFYSNKGVALGRLKRFEEAMFCYLRAIEDDGNYALAYQNFLIVAASKKAWSDVLEMSAGIRGKFSEKPELLDWTAINLLTQTELSLQQGNREISEKLLQEAGKLLELAIGRNPENHSILYNLACYYSRSGRRSEAVETLKKAFEKAAPDDVKSGLKRMARDDVDFGNIREDPLFNQLLADG